MSDTIELALAATVESRGAEWLATDEQIEFFPRESPLPPSSFVMLAAPSLEGFSGHLAHARRFGA